MPQPASLVPQNAQPVGGTSDPSVPGPFPTAPSVVEGNTEASRDRTTFAGRATTAAVLAINTLGSMPGAIHAELTAITDAWTNEQELVSLAASELYVFDRMTKVPEDPTRPANTWNNRASLQNSAWKAIDAIKKTERCDFFYPSKVCDTLEDPKGEYRMTPGTAGMAIKALGQYWADRGLSIGSIFVRVIED